MRHLDRDNEHKNLKYYVHDPTPLNSEKERNCINSEKERNYINKIKNFVSLLNNDLFLQFPL